MTDTEIDKRFGEFVTKAREALSIGVKEAAIKAGINQNRLRVIERGTGRKGIRKAECEKLAKVLAMDLEDLVSRAAGN